MPWIEERDEYSEVTIVGMTVRSPSFGLGVVMPRPESMDDAHRRILKETGEDWPYATWGAPDSPTFAGLANPSELTAVGFADPKTAVA